MAFHRGPTNVPLATVTLKIACIIHSLDGGGAERVLAGLASRLSARSHQVTLVTLGDGQGDRYRVDPAVARERLDLLYSPTGRLGKVRAIRHRIGTLRSTLSGLEPDVVLSFCDRTNVLVSLACPPQLPLVLSERSDPSQQPLGRVWEFARERGYRRATQLVALTETSADHLRQRFCVPVTVIPSAIEPPRVASDRSRAAFRSLVIGVGRLEQEKGFDRLIEAFSIALADQPSWTLRILGEGSCRDQLESLARKLGVHDRVTMPGWSDEVQQELANATFFVLPSRYEGFPSALLEAMAVGVPSIAVDCESGPRAVLTRQANAMDGGVERNSRAVAGEPFPGGLLIENELSSMVNGIGRFASDADIREAYGEVGKEVIQRFGWEPMVDAYEQVLTQAARTNQPRRS